MKKYLAILPAALLLAVPATSGEKVKLSEKQQTQLDKRLEGRTAGEARTCIYPADQRDLTVVSDEVMIFGSRRNAKTIYVNKPYGGCSGAENHILQYSRTNTSLCKGEIVQVIDSTTGTFRGSCSFGAFVPYTRTDS